MDSTPQLVETTVERLGDYFKSLAGFRHSLVERFNQSELKDLCFDLGVDYESLSGSNKADKARELIAYCLRRDKVAELLQKCAALRPGIFNNYLAQIGGSHQPQQQTDATVFSLVARQLQSNTYADETLHRWSLTPESAGARTTLTELLAETLRQNSAFAESLQALLSRVGQQTGDTITQTVNTGNRSQTRNISLIGKVETR